MDSRLRRFIIGFATAIVAIAVAIVLIVTFVYLAKVSTIGAILYLLLLFAIAVGVVNAYDD